MFLSTGLVFSSLLLLVTADDVQSSQPCLDGKCQYVIPQSETSLAGTLVVTGSPNALSDITPAAGWEILNCDPNKKAQDIRLVCVDEQAGCGHLFKNGAEETIVRVPDSCNQGPFARVVSARKSSDQSIPKAISRRIVKRDGETPEVKALKIDENFKGADARHGPVTFHLVGSSIPVDHAEILSPFTRKFRSKSLQKDAARNFVKNGLKTFNAPAMRQSWTINNSANVIHMNVDKQFPLFQKSFDCGGGHAGIDISARAIVRTDVAIGILMTGSFIPPSVDDFALYTNINADIEGRMKLGLDAHGHFGVDKVLFEQGVPGLSISGVVTIGPSLKVLAGASANLNLKFDAEVAITYRVDDVTMYIPASDKHPNVGSLSPRDSPLSISVEEGLQANGLLKAYVTPRVDFGISIFSGWASASVYGDIKAFGALALNATQLGMAGATTGERFVEPDTDQTDSDLVARGSGSASSTQQACVELMGGVSSHIGGQGKISGLFDLSKKWPVFKQKFKIYNNCWSSTASTGTQHIRREYPESSRLSSRDDPSSFDMTCPTDFSGFRNQWSSNLKASDYQLISSS